MPKLKVLSTKRKLLKAKASENLSEARKKDLTDKEQVLEERLVNLHDFMERKDKYSQQKFNQTVRRLSKRLSQQNRLKRRRRGTGA